MATGEQALVNRLEGSTSVTSLCGTRIYPVQMPQEPRFPLLTYEIISAAREPVSGSYFGTVHARYQVTAWAKTYSEASALKEGVRSTLARWTGNSTGVTVHDVLIENEFAFYDDVTETHAHPLDLMFHHEE